MSGQAHRTLAALTFAASFALATGAGYYFGQEQGFKNGVSDAKAQASLDFNKEKARCQIARTTLGEQEGQYILGEGGITAQNLGDAEEAMRRACARFEF